VVGAARAAAMIATSLALWSLNLRWGEVAGVGAGPPQQWERQVVGAALLLALVLLCTLVAGRRGARPGWVVRLLAPGAAVGACAIALVLRRDALRGFRVLLEWPVWRCLSVGAGVGLAAALALQAVGSAVPPGRAPRRRPPR
jgi:hypothetical protein